MLIALLLALLLCGCRAEEEWAVPADGAAPPLPEPEVTGYVALTFDDGPTPRHTARLLDGLQARGAHATFFLAGYRLAGNEALVQRIRDEGHQIGNHSYAHQQLTTLSAADALADLAACDLALCTLLGEGDYWVRPPYGSVSGEVLSQLDVPVVCWSVDPRDWTGITAEQVAEQIVSAAQDGDIVLLHDCYAATVDGALQAVDALQARGIQLVTVKQLLALRGKEAETGQVIYRGK